VISKILTIFEENNTKKKIDFKNKTSSASRIQQTAHTKERERGGLVLLYFRDSLSRNFN